MTDIDGANEAAAAVRWPRCVTWTCWAVAALVALAAALAWALS